MNFARGDDEGNESGIGDILKVVLDSRVWRAVGMNRRRMGPRIDNLSNSLDCAGFAGSMQGWGGAGLEPSPEPKQALQSSTNLAQNPIPLA